VDKLRILKEFERLALKKALETDEIRLYLLLLANCDITGNGKIECRAIKDALGKRFLPNRLNRTCRQLSVHGLIEVITPSFDEISEEDFPLEYRILQLAEELRHERRSDGR